MPFMPDPMPRRRRKTKSRGKSAEHEPSEVLRSFIGAFFLCLALFAVKIWFVEKTAVGQMFEEGTYQLLERRLGETLGQMQDVPVTVIDISPLVPQAIEQGLGGGMATSPHDLLQILNAIAPTDPAASTSDEPTAVGFDIDLSPLDPVNPTPGALEFFKGAAQIHQQLGIPVVVGIHRTESGPSDYRLGYPKYSFLAATMTIPDREQPEVRVMERSITPVLNGTPDPSAKIPSLSAALVPAGQVAQPGTTTGLLSRLGIIENVRNVAKPGLEADEFPIDFSPVKSLIENRIVAKTPADLVRQSHRFANRVVLVGDADPAKATMPDVYMIPGQQSGGLTPGIYVHACAVYTLLRAPLYEFTGKGLLFADLLLFLIAFGPLYLWRWKRAPQGSQLRIGELLFALIGVLVLIGLAHTLVQTTRILWTDFVIGIVAIVLHVAAGELPFHFVHKTEQLMVSFWRRPAKGEQ
jgi:hypothetical protein